MPIIKEFDLGPTAIPLAREFVIPEGALVLGAGLDAGNFRIVVWMLVGDGPKEHNFAVVGTDEDVPMIGIGGKHLASIRLPNGQMAHVFHRT